VAGFVAPVACEIDLLYTHPRTWGRGIGRLLLAAGEAALREAGCPEATLWTEERNARPRGFYEAAGWRTDGGARERVWNGAALRELRYRKAL
jgi:GNAT superfamily N-acetyltransferase